MRRLTELLMKMPVVSMLPQSVAKLRAGIESKLLVSFLAIVALMLALSAIGLWSLQQANERTTKLVGLERQIAAYRQLQHNATSVLYVTASAFLTEDSRELDSALRQLQRLEYDFDRAKYISGSDPDLQETVQSDYQRFTQVATEIIDTIAASKTSGTTGDTAPAAVDRLRDEAPLSDARQTLEEDLVPLASKLERNIYTLVNLAEADILDHADRSAADYRASLLGFIAAALISILAALLLGFVISSSLIDPIRAIRRRLNDISQGEFQGKIEVSNRDELGDLSRSVNQMSQQLDRLYSELEAANRHKSSFLANMSHELRTPMNAIIGFNRIVMRKCKDILPQRQYENLGKIEISANHLLTLINGVLNLSKIESGRIDIQRSKFDLLIVLDDCAKTAEPLTEGKNLVIRTEFDLDDATALLSDQEKLRQIVLNLLGNACKFTENGEVRLGAKANAERVEIWVSDTGVGIPKDKLETIFDEFTQVDDGSTRRFGGTGLGLAISKRLATLLGGRITVSSIEGEGSKFTVSLPMSSAPTESEAA